MGFFPKVTIKYDYKMLKRHVATEFIMKLDLKLYQIASSNANTDGNRVVGGGVRTYHTAVKENLVRTQNRTKRDKRRTRHRQKQN